MAAKEATKTANTVATLYEGSFDITFDCVGVGVCRYALCSMMPPDGSEECTYRDHGTCLCPHAKHAALEVLGNRIKAELKRLNDEEPD